MNIQLIATCPEELQPVLIQELQELGADQISPLYKAILFEVDEAKYYKAHLVLSTASRILKVLKIFKAPVPGTLYGIASKKIPWDEIFSVKQTFRVDGSTEDRGNRALSSNDISKKVRQGIEDYFANKVGNIPAVDLKEPDLVFVAHMAKQKVFLSIESSGKKSLHKRGYRTTSSHEAPLKETLAAAILRLSGYRGDTVLMDPMCGSGTIVIEACFLALQKACNIHRKKGEFGFEQFGDFNSALWRTVQDEVRLLKRSEIDHPIYASDIQETYVNESRQTALRARVEKYIQFSRQSFFDVQKPAETGIIVSNLPYGERLNPRDSSGQEADLEDFYKKVGDHLKQQFTGWKACLLVQDESPWESIGLKPSKKIKILNGSIPSKLLIFDLYAGTKKRSL